MEACAGCAVHRREDLRWDDGPYLESAMLIVVTVLLLCAVAAAAGTLAICREDR
jgi:hypothetical protein